MSTFGIATPGHAPEREGATSADNTPECKWATQVVGMVYAKSYGLDIEAWTRDDGNLNALLERINEAKPEFAIDFHFDASAFPGPCGCSALYAPKASLASTRLASLLVEEVCRATGLVNRGTFVRGDLAYLTGLKCPSVILEAGFGGVAGDWRLMDPNLVASGVIRAIQRWRGM